MNGDKMSREEVPQRFIDWLLMMGCPPEKVPSLDKMAQMCRGQYYMVWRSLMEHVRPKDIVKEQRLQVFYDDLQNCKGKTNDSGTIIPHELSVWREDMKLKQQVQLTETTVQEARHKLERDTNKVSRKLAQRNTARRTLQDAQRRVWFLQTLEDELTFKQDNLNQTLDVARQLCHKHDTIDVQNKLDVCVGSVKTHLQISSSSVAATHPVASSSVMSNTSDTVEDHEEQLTELVKCRADVLWSQLYEKRTKLVETLSSLNAQITGHSNHATHNVTPQMILAHTCSLHCQLGLETMKQRLLLKQAQHNIASALSGFSDVKSVEERESLVLRCEQSKAEARLATLKKLLQELTGRSGAFEPSLTEATDEKPATVKQITQIDRNIMCKKDNIKKILLNLSNTEAKINCAKGSLVDIFEGLQNDANVDSFTNKGGHSTTTAESVTLLREFFRQCNEKRAARVDLSLNLDNTDGSLDASDITEPRFLDELKLYFKKFNLEKNRKLVLDSGEKIWTFETLQASIDRVYSSLIDEDAPCQFVCPSVSLTENLTTISNAVRLRDELNDFMQRLEGKSNAKNICFDVNPYKNEEEEKADEIKKRLNDCLMSLNRTNKALDVGLENLSIWRRNDMKQHISEERKIQGKCYTEWEEVYFKYLNPSF